MTYKIISRKSDNNETGETTVTTLVEYNFDGVLIVISVPHFTPQSEDDIILGIENRAVSEQIKLNNNKN